MQSYGSTLYPNWGGICDIVEAKQAASDLLRKYDSNRNDLIDPPEVSPMLSDVYFAINKGFQAAEGDISSYHRALDQNRDGRVTLEDLEVLAIKYLVGNKPAVVRVEKQKKAGVGRTLTSEAQHRLDVARRLFKRFDTDGSGFIEDKEVTNIIKESYKIMGMDNFAPTEEDVKIWIMMTDTNKDGKVSLDEYEGLVIKSLENAGIKIYE
jgi:Ca2+-binding EF-hand superfamily protein